MAFNVRSAAAIVLVFVIAVAYQVDKSAGADYVVGDSLGWTIPSGGAASYSSWAAGHTFLPGDVLVFNFTTGMHDVAKVDKASFDSCSASNPTTLVTVGPANLTLTSAGDQYFICTFGQHCAAGQKLTLKVTAAASTPPPTPATSLPTPAAAPKPTPASPPSTPTTSSPPPSVATPAPPTIAPMPPSSGSGSTMMPPTMPPSSSSGSTPPAMTPTMPPSSGSGSTPTMTPTMPPSSSSGTTPPAMAPTMPPAVAGGTGVPPGPLTPGGGLGPGAPTNTIAPAGSATNSPTGSATTTTASTMFGLVVAIAAIAINCY